MLSKQKVLENISELKSFDGNRKYKYRRNYRYYNATKGCSLENIRNPMIVGYYSDGMRELGEEADTSANPQLNVIASCVDTLHSKIAQTKVRPFFTTINGTFKDIQCVKQAQQYFDVFYDLENVYKKVSDCFRDCCVFDTGVIYIDEEAKTINRALPFQVYIRPAEAHYGKISRVFYEQKDFPVSLLPEKIYSKFRNRSMEYVDYGIYYDSLNHTKAYTGNGTIILTETYTPDEVPFVFMYYKNPILGNVSTSVADMLISIQQEINILMAKIKDASQLNSALTFLVPEGSTIKATQLNNRVGNVIQYKPIQGGGAPVTSATPAFIDNQYITLLNELIDKAGNLVGLSELSRFSKKPTGLNSGISLSTMEDIESDRFETQLNQVIRCYVDIAKKAIKVFPQDEDILPQVSSRCSIKWQDIVKESNNMNIQYSGADNLSKDPSEKLKQLQQLAMAGVIPAARIPQLMQIPDLEMGYSLSNNAVDAVMAVIKDCIENDNFNVPEFVPFELLKEEIINTQLSLTGAGYDKNRADIEKLEKLFQNVEDIEKEWTTEAETKAAQDTENAAAAKNNESGVPYNQSILEQEAQMTRTEPETTAAAAVTTPDMTSATSSTNPRDKDLASWTTPDDINRT